MQTLNEIADDLLNYLRDRKSSSHVEIVHKYGQLAADLVVSDGYVLMNEKYRSDGIPAHEMEITDKGEEFCDGGGYLKW